MKHICFFRHIFVLKSLKPFWNISFVIRFEYFSHFPTCLSKPVFHLLFIWLFFIIFVFILFLVFFSFILLVASNLKTAATSCIFIHVYLRSNNTLSPYIVYVLMKVNWCVWLTSLFTYAVVLAGESHLSCFPGVFRYSTWLRFPYFSWWQWFSVAGLHFSILNTLIK